MMRHKTAAIVVAFLMGTALSCSDGAFTDAGSKKATKDGGKGKADAADGDDDDDDSASGPSGKNNSKGSTGSPAVTGAGTTATPDVAPMVPTGEGTEASPLVLPVGTTPVDLTKYLPAGSTIGSAESSNPDVVTVGGDNALTPTGNGDALVKVILADGSGVLLYIKVINGASEVAPPPPDSVPDLTPPLKDFTSMMIANGFGEAGGPIGVGMDAWDRGQFTYSFVREETDRTGVRVAVGDFDGDGVQEWAVAAGDGGGPRVAVLKRDAGATNRMYADFFAFDNNFTGGAFIAACDVNKDGKDDLIVGAGEGGGPRVKIYSAGNPGAQLFDFFVFDDVALRLGAIVGCGDVDGDGHGDVIASVGKGGGPHVRVFSLASGTPALIRNFMANGIEPGFRGGLYVAGGDVNGDGFSDIIVGAGDGGGPRVSVYSGIDGSTVLMNFFAYEESSRCGVRVGAFSKTKDAVKASVLTVAGNCGSNRISAWDIDNTSNAFYNEIKGPTDFRGGGYIAGRPRR